MVTVPGLRLRHPQLQHWIRLNLGFSFESTQIRGISFLGRLLAHFLFGRLPNIFLGIGFGTVQWTISDQNFPTSASRGGRIGNILVFLLRY